MSPAPGGAGRATFALRIALLSLASVVVGCSANPASGALKVEVVLEAGLISRCVKVTATDGMLSRETKAIALAGKSSPLNVGVTADGMTQPVTVQALGYSDEACTTRAPGEESERKEGNFTNPPSTVTLTLRPAANGDGGTDGGANDGGLDGGLDGGMDAGTDAGTDAGVDQDNDGYSPPDDCNDNDPLIHPGVAESCSDGVDNDCDNQTDCQATSCSGMTCAGGGMCTSNVCVGLTESVCNDGMDNNNNGLVDCADPDCPLNTICTDNNVCTVGDRCVASTDGGAPFCAKVGDFACTTPPAAQCYAMTGTCVADGGANCVYTQTTGSCNDGFACTTGDTCANGACSGTQIACPAPGNACVSQVGTCQEPSGLCFYSPLPQGTGGPGVCNDGNNCTVMDTCDGDGGCKGTAVNCTTPNQCQNASTGCDVAGNCIYPARTGQACDAGTGAGTCDTNAACNANPTTLFPTPPSNFTEAQLPTSGTAMTVSCATVLNTSGTPAITDGGCVTMPPNVTITQSGGSEPAVLVRVSSLTVNAGQTLTIVGSRPVIFAVTGNVQISGTIRVANDGAPATCGNGGNGTNSAGGGGAGFGTAGAVGGLSNGGTNTTAGAANGTASLTPLRGGCSGGNGSGTGGTGGLGGGALQIVASGTINIAATAIITAPGRGGSGGSGSNAGGGGGGSGGAILLEAPTVAITGAAKITANGGGGGGGEDASTVGGAGGSGSETSRDGGLAGTANAGAGLGGTGGGTLNTDGGFAGPTKGEDDDNDGAGGGGGAVGRIRINATTCTITSGQLISPLHTGTTCN